MIYGYVMLKMQENTSLTEKFVPSSTDLDKAANVVFGNPDDSKIGMLPDGYRGLSTLTAQKLQKQINLQTYGVPTDLWVVQWPIEPVGTAAIDAGWLIGLENGTTDYPNVVRLANSNPDWAAGGFANSLRIGGLCCYVMEAGKSPFPGPNGPYNPLDTIQLNYDKDVFHDNARLIGGYYEVINTTASLYTQGSSYHASLENPTNETATVLFTSIPYGSPIPPGATRAYGTVVVDQDYVPLGDVSVMQKVRNSATMAAKEGVFAPLRINVCDNAPTQGISANTLFTGPTSFGSFTCPAGGRVLLSCGGLVRESYVEGTPNTDPQAVIQSFTGKAYKTNANVQVSAFLGLAAQTSFTVIRRAISHCLCTPSSEYFSFANYGDVPPDGAAMSALQAAIDITPDFYTSEWNANGKAWGKMSGVFKKALKAAKPFVAPVKAMAKQVAAPMIQSAIQANPQLAIMQAGIKAVRKNAKAAKKTRKMAANKNNKKTLRTSPNQ